MNVDNGRMMTLERTAGPQDFGDWLTTREVARLLRAHETTVRRWSKSGLLKSYRVGLRGHRRYLKADILSCIHKFD